MPADASLLLSRVRRLLSLPARVPLSAWADEYRRLSSEASASAGPWRSLPFQREPLDAISPGSPFEQVVFVWASQMGKSELLLNLIAYIIALEPGPALAVQPTLSMAEAFSKDRVAPLIRDCPVLRGKVMDPKSREAGSTIYHRRFTGGHLTMVGSNSPSGLASRPVRYLLLDEVDRYEESAGSEGDPVSLARARTRTFWNRKIIMTSSPTIDGASRIQTAWLESDQREFEVPCPLCDHFQQLVWTRVEWPENKPEEAAYRCAGCGELIPHHRKDVMVAGGRWRATNPRTSAGVLSATGESLPETVSGRLSKIAGFHLSELYSPWRSWSDLAEDFIKAEGQPERLRAFWNTSLAEVWQEEALEIPDSEALMARREPYQEGTAPAGGCFLTAGVDVQADRLEVEIVAWGKDYESWSVAFYVLPGAIDQPAVWQRLDEVLTRSYPHASGMPLTLQAVAIDAGFSPSEVTQFTRRRHGQRVYACKGSSNGWGRPIWPRKASWNKTKDSLYLISADEAKAWTANRLRIELAGPGYCHTPLSRDRVWFEQLTAEKLIIDRGRRKWTKPIHARNEACDCRALSVAALHSRLLAGLDLNAWCDAFEKMLEPPDPTPALVNGAAVAQPRPVYRSRFVNG